MDMKFLTVEEVSQRLGLSISTVKRMLYSGELTGHKVRRSWRINPSDLEKYLEESKNTKREQQN